ncbi:MAG: PAS domain-containing protein, partial [Deltaproteobacteria bacterium]|nr:PAS domain-containing protein [Nannocystaceae bacterium]
MNAEQLASQISKMQARAEQLREDAVGVPEAPAVLQRALAELFTSVEELRVAEEELREQNDALVRANAEIERERRRYAELFQLAPVAFVVTDARGVLTEVNRVAAALLQQPAAGLVGKPIAL